MREGMFIKVPTKVSRGTTSFMDQIQQRQTTYNFECREKQ